MNFSEVGGALCPAVYVHINGIAILSNVHTYVFIFKTIKVDIKQ